MIEFNTEAIWGRLDGIQGGFQIFCCVARACQAWNRWRRKIKGATHNWLYTFLSGKCQL